MRGYIKKIEANLEAIWRIPLVSRAVHTYWQAFLAVFMLGITGVLATAMKSHSVPLTEDATLALIVASIAAGLSAVKTVIVGYVQGQKA